MTCDVLQRFTCGPPSDHGVESGERRGDGIARSGGAVGARGAGIRGIKTRMLAWQAVQRLPHQHRLVYVAQVAAARLGEQQLGIMLGRVDAGVMQRPRRGAYHVCHVMDGFGCHGVLPLVGGSSSQGVHITGVSRRGVCRHIRHCVAKCAPKRSTRAHSDANHGFSVPKCAHLSFRRALSDAETSTGVRFPREPSL